MNTKFHISHLVVLITLVSGSVASFAASPSFQNTSSPDGWTIVRGQAETGSVLETRAAVPLELETAASLELPVEATLRFRVSEGGSVGFTARDGTNDLKPLLQCSVRLTGHNQAHVSATASGEQMETDTISTRVWTGIRKKSGAVGYSWRFPRVKNLWEEPDRREIGAAYAELTPFDEKVFTLRMILTPAGRQVWLDDRLVAEERTANPKQAQFGIVVSKGGSVLSAEFTAAQEDGRFLPLSLAHHSHAKEGQRGPLTKLGSESIPAYLSQPGLDLGATLYRYRLTTGSGPDASYVNGKASWPGAFEVDPATFLFRVPYRNYQNVWLLAWLDEKPNTVPRGTFRFFRPDAGYPASTDFEVTDAAKIPQKTADGKQLYLVRVPVDTDRFQGFRDMAHQFLEFELSKPVALGRSYPDPIYYGYHPAGLPSSVHVVGITLETAPFDYSITPKQFGFVFEQPEKPSFTISVTNTSDKSLEATVTLHTKSFDGTETNSVSGNSKLEPGAAADVALSFDLQRLGWHELRAVVEAGGVTRSNTLSLVLLPPNTRTYGTASNETRFGIWSLWGHYLPMQAGTFERNETILAMFRKLGLRRIALHKSFFKADQLKRHDFLPKAPHTDVGVFHRLDENDPEAMRKMVEAELAQVAELAKDFDQTCYFYGGEWHLGREIQYAPWPRYTGDGDRELNDEERPRAERQTKIFTAIGKAMREKFPNTKLYLQWGAPQGTLAYLKFGIPKEIVDCFGMDAPMFELLPEVSNVTGSINNLWWLRAEAEKLGWPRLPIGWCEGPFFPTNPGALTEKEQAEYQVRYWLLGLAYGIENFEASVVDFDAGNYYGAEHYGAGLFHRLPLENPKPAVAAIATATTMLCGADVAGGVDTGVLTTYCMAFQRAKTKEMIYALWRVNGTVEATLKVAGKEAVVTDSMGNATKLPVKDGTVSVRISSSPIWLTGVEKIESFTFGPPKYEEAPARIVRTVTEWKADEWTFDTSEDRTYAHNHFAIRRIANPNMKAEGLERGVRITLPVEPGDRPLVTRYAVLNLKKPALIPGKATALGLNVDGNASWGRVVFRLRDAKGETWTSVGTKDDWNCDDTHAWSYVSFEGTRYVRFPLPGTHPYDCSRELETTWWGSHGGDGIVDLPLSLEKVFVEARNEVPYLSVMKLVPNRTYTIGAVVAEYDSEADTTDAAIALNQIRKPLPEWTGPTENKIAKLLTEGVGDAPAIREFVEPGHWNDGRRMIIRFDAAEGLKYNLYLSRYEDGRGAELLKADVKDKQLVVGLKPEVPLHLFLTSVGADKKESKPSKPFRLVTRDNFAEK
jgi:hypothetical protein